MSSYVFGLAFAVTVLCCARLIRLFVRQPDKKKKAGLKGKIIFTGVVGAAFLALFILSFLQG